MKFLFLFYLLIIIIVNNYVFNYLINFYFLQIKYLNKYWDCKCTVEEHPDEFSILSFTNNEEKSETNANVINFGVRTEFHQGGGTHIKTLYCPFWIINKTEKSLTYKVLFYYSLFCLQLFICIENIWFIKKL